jgi:hypothetical protein
MSHTRPDLVAAYTVLATHGWTLLLRCQRGTVWQWRDSRIILVPANPVGANWWRLLWKQAGNIMTTLQLAPASGAEWHRATIEELVRKGLHREAHSMACRDRVAPWPAVAA